MTAESALGTVQQIIIGLIVLAILLIIAGFALGSMGVDLSLSKAFDIKKINIAGTPSMDFDLNGDVLYLHMDNMQLSADLSSSTAAEVQPVAVFKGNVGFPTTTKFITVPAGSSTHNGMQFKMTVKSGTTIEPSEYVTVMFFKKGCNAEGSDNAQELLAKCAEYFISSDSVAAGTGYLSITSCMPAADEKVQPYGDLAVVCTVSPSEKAQNVKMMLDYVQSSYCTRAFVISKELVSDGSQYKLRWDLKAGNEKIPEGVYDYTIVLMYKMNSKERTSSFTVAKAFEVI